MIVALNGMAIRALVVGGEILDKPAYTGFARRAGERIWRLAYDRSHGRLSHEIYRGTAQTDGFLADYAELGRGFLALHEAGGETVWLDRARALGEALLGRFSREDGTLATGPNEGELPLAPVDTEDNTVPSGTSSAVTFLFALGEASGDGVFSAAAARTLRGVSGRIAARPSSWPSAIAAAGHYLTDEPPGDDPLTKRMPPVLAQNEGFVQSDASPEEGDDGSFHVPDTADFVAASAARQRTAEGDTLLIVPRSSSCDDTVRTQASIQDARDVKEDGSTKLPYGSKAKTSTVRPAFAEIV